MKLNQTLIIAGLIAGGVFAANTAVRAQGSTNTPPAVTQPRPPGARPSPADFVAKQLALNDDQKEKIKPILEERQQKAAELRKDTTLSPTDRRAKMKEIREATDAKMKEVLTADQYEKWTKMGAGRPRPAGAGAPPPGGTPPPATGATPPAAGTPPAQQ